MKKTIIFLVLLSACSKKREILFTGIISPGDSISIYANGSDINLAAPGLYIDKRDVFYLYDSRIVEFNENALNLNIKIDSSGIRKLDTIVFIHDTIRRPNILFESPFILNFKRRVVLSDYSLFNKY